MPGKTVLAFCICLQFCIGQTSSFNKLLVPFMDIPCKMMPIIGTDIEQRRYSVAGELANNLAITPTNGICAIIELVQFPTGYGNIRVIHSAIDIALERCFQLRTGLSHLNGLFTSGNLLHPLRADADKYRFSNCQPSGSKLQQLVLPCRKYTHRPKSRHRTHSLQSGIPGFPRERGEA